MMIRVEGLCFEHRDFMGKTTKLLEDISFEISENDQVILLGINGSGKSTLLKILDGLLFATKGAVYYRSHKLTRRSFASVARSFRKDVAFLMQDPNMILFNPTVYEEIAFGLRQFGFSDIKERVESIARRFGLVKHLQKPPFFLSGGEKQRVALAALLAVEPKLLLMDEPTANLDPTTTAWLVELVAELGITTVTATHNLSLAPELGSRALVLSPEHTLVFDGELESFLNDETLMIEAGLMHKHKHTHNGVVHSHFHRHDW